jgi:hypothetical protein
MQLQPPPEKFLSTLLEIRNYYAPLVEKYAKLYREALDNLTHVEALLSNWALQKADSNGITQHRTEERLTLPAQNGTHSEASKTKPEVVINNTELPQVNIKSQSIYSQNQAILPEENLSNGSNSLDVSPDENSSDEAANVEPTPAIKAEATAKGESDTKDTPQAARELAQFSTSEPSPQEDELPVAESTKPNKSLLKQDIPMLGEYQSLSRIEAVEKLLKNHAGSIFHIDFIMRSLYGELEPKAWKVVKGRVQSTLTQGRESGKWSLVPGKPGYYTVDLKLLNSKNKDSSAKSSQTKNEKPDTQQSQTKPQKPNPQAKANLIPMQGEFEGKFVIDAISLLLEQNPRRVFDVAEVVNKLYGELSPEQLQKVRPGVLNELSRGYRSGRFSRVPEEKGLYIWDAKLLPD